VRARELGGVGIGGSLCRVRVAFTAPTWEE
jgi:hypothetical protein